MPDRVAPGSIQTATSRDEFARLIDAFAIHDSTTVEMSEVKVKKSERRTRYRGVHERNER